jgi:hypothetical protein
MLPCDDTSAVGFDELWTPDETARALRVSRQRLARWRSRNQGPPFLRLGGPGGRIVYPRTHLAAWLSQRVCVPGPKADPATA